MNIHIEHFPDELTKETWEFYFNPDRMLLRLVRYGYWKRESTRKRKYVAERWHDTYNKRDSSLPMADAPLPEDVKQEAFNKFISQIVVDKFI